ncbi:hypothetical protein AVEN_59402-1 [Araneus ventricosus]|uniref:Uncharacterized protein n=1 Tax=Araneus ventricosus TaxID=182803 RepID=A0A4Y2J8G8_ARAVE|nr:hypothetical protein AVEN_59402-1 [Araneus ventricosus]
MTLYPVTPFPPCRPGYMKNDRHNNSVTEVVVLTALTGHGRTLPKEVRIIIGKGYLRLHHYFTPRRSETLLTYPATSDPRTRGAPWWELLITVRTAI